jgi:hypothetical protein
MANAYALEDPVTSFMDLTDAPEDSEGLPDFSLFRTFASTTSASNVVAQSGTLTHGSGPTLTDESCPSVEGWDEFLATNSGDQASWDSIEEAKQEKVSYNLFGAAKLTFRPPVAPKRKLETSASSSTPSASKKNKSKKAKASTSTPDKPAPCAPPKCNDRTGADIEGLKHGKPHLCTSLSHEHTSEAVYTCDACHEETESMLSDEELEALYEGQESYLCKDCGDERMNDPNSSDECRCLTDSQCGECLMRAAWKHLEAKKTLTLMDEAMCLMCQNILTGEETVSICHVCGGGKVRSSSVS